jgi:two-component system alkaline phosphatase synthesis response regulator PhoP
MSTSPKILIVDDDPDFIEIGKLSLEGKGYRVLSASTGKEGWEMVEKETPDLIILDLMMEDLDAGMALSGKIKSHHRYQAIPILMLTSISRETGMDFTPRTEEDLKKLRVDDFHSKPIKPRLLLEKVETLLRRRADRKEG